MYLNPATWDYMWMDGWRQGLACCEVGWLLCVAGWMRRGAGVFHHIAAACWLLCVWLAGWGEGGWCPTQHTAASWCGCCVCDWLDGEREAGVLHSTLLPADVAAVCVAGWMGEGAGVTQHCCVMGCYCWHQHFVLWWLTIWPYLVMNSGTHKGEELIDWLDMSLRLWHKQEEGFVVKGRDLLSRGGACSLLTDKTCHRGFPLI